MLAPHESLSTTKAALLNALQSRNLSEINGDPIPDDPSAIELGAAVDRNDPEKGWTKLEDEMGVDDADEATESSGKATGAVSLQAADLRNGQAVAFRFRRTQDRGAEERDELDVDLGAGDQGWDVVLPSLDEEEGEEAG